MKFIDPYKILGVHRKSSERDIRDAFHDLAWIHHPDHDGNADEFHKVNEAYMALKDKKRRQEWLEAAKVFADKCERCGGEGCVSKSKGLTQKQHKPCEWCGGSGFIIIEEKETSNVIELRGAAGAGRKGSDNQRGKSGAGKRGKR